MRRQTLKRKNCLKSSLKISELLKTGKRDYGKLIAVYNSPAEEKTFAVLVRKKTGNAVQRNKIKRWVREIYRRESTNFTNPAKLIILVDKPFEKLSFSALENDIKTILYKLFFKYNDGYS